MRQRGLLTLGLALVTLAPAAARDYIHRIIDDTYEPDVYNRFENETMNAAGTVVYGVDLERPEEEIRILDSAGMRVLVSRANGYAIITDIALNDNGLMVFATNDWGSGGGVGIFGTYDGQSFITFLDSSEDFSWIYAIDVNNQGVVAFIGSPPTYGVGLFTSDGATLSPIVYDDDVSVSSADAPSINDSNEIAFSGALNSVNGVFLVNADGITPVALSPDFAASSPHVDNDGVAYFFASTDVSSSGIYRSENGVTTPVVTAGVQFAWIDRDFAVGPDGTVAFKGDETDGTDSIFVVSPTELRRVLSAQGYFYGAYTSPADKLYAASIDANGRVLIGLTLTTTYPFDAVLVATPAPAPSEIIHVKSDASGHDDGTSWDDAFANLRDALDFTAPGDQVWLAAGTHKPDHTRYGTPGSRDQLFLLQPGASIYGGFAGDELTLDDRAGLFDQTILSGDLDGDDEPNFVNYEDNSYVVMAAGYELGAPCTIDGLTVTAGAYGITTVDPPIAVFGAGLSINTDAVVRNSAFTLNRSTNQTGNGGGVVVSGGTVTFEGCSFEGNQRERYDGAASLYVDGAAVTVQNCVFRQNGPYNGAAVSDSPAVTISDCSFVDNAYALEILRGQAALVQNCDFIGNARRAAYVHLTGADEHITIEDCTFSNNAGGGLQFGNTFGVVDESTYVVRGCIFSQNQSRVGAGLAAYLGNVFVENCQFFNNVAPSQGGSYPSGGGVWTGDARTTLINCDFIGNRCTPGGYGGGLRVAYDARTTVINCLFRDNYADYGGAVACFWDAPPLFIQCRMEGNRAELGGAVYANRRSLPTFINSTIIANEAETCGGVLADNLNVVLHVYNSIIRDNHGQGGYAEVAQISGDSPDIKYSCVGGWTGALGGVGNFGDDPLFVDPLGPDGVPGTGDEDMRLQPGSPCIDRGSNWLLAADSIDMDDDGDFAELWPLDYEGESRFFNDPNTPGNSCGDVTIVDIGPYEFGDASPPPCVGDVDGDGFVELDDLACLLARYGSAAGEPEFDGVCDFDVNGEIDLSDLATLLGAYGQSCE